MKRPLLFKGAAFVVSAICLSGAAFVWAPRPKLAWMTESVSFAPVVAVLGIVGVILSTFAYRNRPAGAVILTGMVPLLLTGTIALWIIPGLNPHLSLKPLARRILTIEKNSPRVGGYRTDFRYLAYYLHAPYHKLNNRDELNQFVREGRGFLVIDGEDRKLVADAAERPLLKVGQFLLKGKTFFLLMTQERPEGAFDFIIG